MLCVGAAVGNDFDLSGPERLIEETNGTYTTSLDWNDDSIDF